MSVSSAWVLTQQASCAKEERLVVGEISKAGICLIFFSLMDWDVQVNICLTLGCDGNGLAGSLVFRTCLEGKQLLSACSLGAYESSLGMSEVLLSNHVLEDRVLATESSFCFCNTLLCTKHNGNDGSKVAFKLCSFKFPKTVRYLPRSTLWHLSYRENNGLYLFCQYLPWMLNMFILTFNLHTNFSLEL